MFPIHQITTAFRSFHPASLPSGSRFHYRREVLAWAFLPMMMGAAEGGVIGVLAKRFFTGYVDDTLLDWSVAAITAAQGVANISGFAWAAISHGRHKIRFLTALSTITVFLVAGIAMTQRTPGGLLWLLCCFVGARVCWSGVITLRTAVWQANYPRAGRARIAGKIATVQAIIFTVASLCVGELMNVNDESYRWVFPIAAVMGMVGTLFYSRMRVRGHKAMLKAERVGRGSLASAPIGAARLLVEDPDFGRYMVCQFVYGLGNLMVMAPLVVALAERFEYGYLGQIAIVSTIPIALIPITVPLWARFLDRVHIIRFRAWQGWVFVTSSVLFAVGVLTGGVVWLWFGAIIRGIGFGGGVLAWNLGHQDFAAIEESGRYMGVHMTLTGIRALIAPALGMGTYFAMQRLGDPTGGATFAIAAAISSLGTIGFVLMLRHHK